MMFSSSFVFAFSSLLMSRFSLLPQNEDLLLTNAPALGGMDANAFGSEAAPLLLLALESNRGDLDAISTLFSSFVSSTSRGHSTSCVAGGSPAMSGRKTHAPTMIPRTNWITSSGFMVAYPRYVLQLMLAYSSGLADMKFFFSSSSAEPACQQPSMQNLDFFRRFRIQIARTSWKQGTAEIDREI